MPKRRLLTALSCAAALLLRHNLCMATMLEGWVAQKTSREVPQIDVIIMAVKPRLGMCMESCV